MPLRARHIAGAALIFAIAIVRAEPCAAQAPDDERARALLDETLARYAELDTYSDSFRAEFLMRYGSREAPAERRSRIGGAFAFERAGRVALHGSGGSFVLSGGVELRRDAARERYTRDEAPGQLADVDMTSAVAADGEGGENVGYGHPVFPLLIPGADKDRSMLHMVERTTGMGAVTLEGKRHTVIHVEFNLSGLFREFVTYMDETGKDLNVARAKGEITIDPNTGLIRLVTFDTAEAYNEIMDQMADEYGPAYAAMIQRYHEITYRYSFRDARADAPLSDDAFAFDTTGMELVDSLEPDFEDSFADAMTDAMGEAAGDRSSREAAEHVHAPAPAFEGQTLAGGTLALEEYRGKVVLVDFWATWCPPCVVAMPELQKIHQEFADRGLVVLGVNLDSPDMRQDVVDFVEQKGITFPQVMDTGEISAAYSIGSIPTTVLIDRQGIVQSYHVGFSGAEKYRDEIRRVLAGERLDKPAAPPELITAEMFKNPEAATMGETRDAMVSAWIARTVQTPKGATLYMIADDGGISRLNPDTGALEWIGSTATPGRSVAAFTPAPIDAEAGRYGWAMATTSDFDESGDLHVEYYGPDFRKRWTAELRLDTDESVYFDPYVEAGDVTGDGRLEFVLLTDILSGDTYESEGQMVMIIDEAGKVICKRDVDLDGSGAIQIIPRGPGRPADVVLFGISEMTTLRLEF